MVFVETRAFSARIRQLLPEEDYRLLQLLLAGRPDAGRVVVATGGIRKIRVGTAGRGRSGGLRVFYYWHPPTSRILFLFVFAKNEQGDLTPSQKADLRRVIETEYP